MIRIISESRVLNEFEIFVLRAKRTSALDDAHR